MNSGNGGGKIISVASMKGGVGKTLVTANLGLTLSKDLGHPCLLVDANTSNSSLSSQFNLDNPKTSLQDVLRNENVPVQDAIHVSQHHLSVIPSSSSFEKLPQGALSKRLGAVKKDYSIILLDTAPSCGPETKEVFLACDEAIIVSTLDLPSVTAALKTARMVESLGKKVFGVVLNRVRHDAIELDMNNAVAIMDLPIIGIIPEDRKVAEAVSKNKLLMQHAPNSHAAKAIKQLARNVPI